MRIIVCVKHVVDSTEIRVDKKTGELVLRGLPTKINDYDKNAITEAVRIKKEFGGEIILLSIGPKEAVKTLKEALAMGADKAYLLPISAQQSLDTKQTSEILGKMVEKVGAFDVLLCGEVSEDGYNSQTGPRLAERLHIPHISSVTKLTVTEDSAVAERTTEDVVETVQTSLPALMTVNSNINLPKLPTAIQIMKVQTSRIVQWKLADLGMEEADLDQPAVKMLGYEIPVTERKNIMIAGEPDAAASTLLQYLKEEGVF